MKFSKKNFLNYVSKNITSDDLKYVEDYVQMDSFSISQVQDVFDKNVVPTKNYFDFCFHIEEYFSDWVDGKSLGYDYLFIYMGSLFLYCSSKIEPDSTPDATSLYLSRIIQILRKHDDVEGGRGFYNFLSSIDASDDLFSYLLVVGKAFLMRVFLIRLRDVGSVKSQLQLLTNSLNELSHCFVTDRRDMSNGWVRLNRDLPVRDELQSIDFDKILLPAE